MLTPANARTLAEQFLTACRADGFSVSIRNTAVSISKTFTPNDRDAFVSCDMSYNRLFSLVPASGGSIWGTDGGSIGGHVALTSGRFTMNISGVKARFISALAPLV